MPENAPDCSKVAMEREDKGPGGEGAEHEEEKHEEQGRTQAKQNTQPQAM
jgi:hypothetical protein